MLAHACFRFFDPASSGASGSMDDDDPPAESAPPRPEYLSMDPGDRGESLTALRAVRIRERMNSPRERRKIRLRGS
jgi:hypothetical protein